MSTAYGDGGASGPYAPDGRYPLSPARSSCRGPAAQFAELA
jgi:hypothetical protein